MSDLARRPLRQSESIFGSVSGATDAAPATERPLSVAELTRQIRILLERGFPAVFVEGEILNFRPAGSGHIYFNLKDESALIKCVMWKSEAARLGKRLPKDGDRVEIRGQIALYEPRGEYQIVVSQITAAGRGALLLRLEELKQKLAAEGLFDEKRKRKLPQFPQRIAVVTSKTGAAIRDILKVLRRRACNVQVFIWDARVQGAGAAGEIAHGINRINALDAADLLIVGRGGGSLEDLWAFNEEIVVRAVANSRIPTICAVGHEIDFSLADYAADVRAATPSQAAEIAVLNSQDSLRDLENKTTRLKRAMFQRYEFLRSAPHMRARLEALMLPRVRHCRMLLSQFLTNRAIRIPQQRMNEARQRLDDLRERAIRSLSGRIEQRQYKHKHLAAHLGALNPKAILARGYSITFDAENGQIIHDAKGLLPGHPLRILLSKDTIEANVSGSKRYAVHHSQKRAANRPHKRHEKIVDWFGAEPKGKPDSEPSSDE